MPPLVAAGEGEQADVAVVGGKHYQQLADPAGVNVWLCQKLATKTAVTAPAAAPASQAATGRQAGQAQPQPQRGQQQQQPQVLGFVCHLKASDQLLLLTNLHGRAAAAQLQQHPALALLLQQPGRVAGVLHLAAPGVAGSKDLRQLCQQLQPAAEASGGQQLLLEQPGPHKSQQVRRLRLTAPDAETAGRLAVCVPACLAAWLATCSLAFELMQLSLRDIASVQLPAALHLLPLLRPLCACACACARAC